MSTEHDSSVVCNSNPFCYVPIPARLTTKLNSLDYNMDHRYRGYCIIFDIENFEPSKNLPRRHGSSVDSNGLYNLFRSMSFDVRIYKNLTRKQIAISLEQVAKLDHSNNDCFACCIMTHGEHGYIYGTDGKMPINLMFDYFLGDKCPTLVGKPKMFFVQACQGDKLDHGVNVVADDALDSTTEYIKLPAHADFLVAYSTLAGFYSWRNTQEGSWFMQALIQVLGDYHEDLDLLTMLTIVNHRVAYYKSSNAKSPEFNEKKQVPCITSMLTRRVFLKSKVLT